MKKTDVARETNPYWLSDEEIDLFYSGRSTKAYSFMGNHFVPGLNAHRFCLWAPNAFEVYVVGDFNSWNVKSDPMERYRGLWVVTVKGLSDGENYKYYLKGADGVWEYKTDPYAFHCETTPANSSKVWAIDGYRWKDREWMKKREKKNILKEPVSIYELHPGSWRKKPDYEFPAWREMAEELAEYASDMGFTHVELMPVNEFPFDGSWGYQVTGFFAITSRFGTPQDFMYFVDRLHKAGIGVLVDWVPAHFPKDIHGLPHFDGTWLYEHKNPIRREHPQWGTHIFNYNRPEVKSFLISSAAMLIDVYHLDGLRVDAVSSMIYLDYGKQDNYVPNKDGGNIDYEAVGFLKDLNSSILGSHPGVFTVAEESTAFPLVTKPPYIGGLGFTFKWNMGFMHDTLEYMHMDPLFRKGAHDKMTFSMYYAFSENYILAYSHDEVVHGKQSMIDKMHGDYDEKIASLKTLYAFMFAHPGKKLLFMGNEFAQFIEWNYKKPLEWELLNYDSHRGVQSFVRSLNESYASMDAFFAMDDSWEGFTWLNVEDRSNSVFAFMRTGKEGRMVGVFNFTPVARENYYVAMPADGTLELILNSDDECYYGKGAAVEKEAETRKIFLNGFEQGACLTLPPLSALFYRFEESVKEEDGDKNERISEPCTVKKE